MYTVSRFREGKGRLSRLFFFFFFFILAANRGRRRADRTDRFFSPPHPPSPPDFCDAREFETSPTPPRENILVHGFSTDWSFFQIRRIFKIPYSFFVCLFRAGTKKKNSRYGSNPYPESLSTSHTFVSSWKPFYTSFRSRFRSNEKKRQWYIYI